MIEAILPREASTAEHGEDTPAAELHPSELAAVGRAVPDRRRQFTAGRACARRALVGLGLAPLPVPADSGGAPLWPAGVLGSITHCEGYGACAVARRGRLAGLGIDAEPNLPLPDGVLEAIATREEIALVGRLAGQRPEVSWDRLLFSAKEALYKAWHPLSGRRLGFADASVTVEADSGTFRARLLVPGPAVAGRRLQALRGRWLAEDGLLLTAVSVSGEAAGPPLS